MATPEMLAKQVEEARAEIHDLKAQLKTSQAQVCMLLELVEAHQRRLQTQESSIVRLDRILMEILNGRTWRTLRAAGKALNKLMPNRIPNGNGSVALSDLKSYLACDEPKANERRPRSGVITVRGWCVAEIPVDALVVSIPGLEPVRTSPTVPRPDVKKALPAFDQTGRSGFTAELDSRTLQSGSYVITVRAFSGGTPLRELKIPLLIDHNRGFATDYDRWIQEFERPDDDFIKIKLPSFAERPKISILMASFNTDPDELAAAIYSVEQQSYENWELCIADDASTSAATRDFLTNYTRQNDRIKCVFQSERGGISKAFNAAWSLATGDYIGFLDHDDTLAPHALAYVCETINRAPDADLVYSDEDKIDRAGKKRFDPFFKPDWSPDLLLSENYVCHLLVIARRLAARLGSFHSDCDGSQDYDLILRATEIANRIEHIPRVLYHWRAGTSSTASSIGNKQYALEAAHEALRRHCQRMLVPMSIEPGKVVGRWRARYPIAEKPQVSIIIASGGKTNILRTNLQSLFSKTDYAHYEVVVVDNSKVSEIERLVGEFQKSSRTTRLRYLDWRNKPFNYSEINNYAARQSSPPVLLFLNDDTSVINSEWLEAMVELAARPEVGVVGARLLYPDGRIQHAGVVMGLYDNCGHAFKGLDGRSGHYFDFPDVIRNVSAVTGACLMTRAEVFWKVNGFDEHDFAVAFNDIDLCLKIGAAGFRVLYTPHAQLHHHEAFSKTSKDLLPHPREVAQMRAKWGNVIEADPYYSPNLTRNDEDYSLRTRS